MHKLFLIVICLLLFTSQATAQPKGLPDAFNASYSVARGSIGLGYLNASLKYSGDNYEYEKYTKATGMAALLTGIKITENTKGQISGWHVIPKSYLYDESRRNKSRIDKTQFIGKRAVGSYKDEPYDVVIPTGAQDRASMELALARDVAQNKPRLQYNIFERGEVKQYSFQKMGTENINTPIGDFQSIKVKVVRDGSKRETIFWLAEKVDFLPVKIMHTEKKEVITTMINSYKKL